MLKNYRASILMVLTGVVLSGCLSSTEKLAMLPEPKINRPFIAGWQPSTADISDKDAHRNLQQNYNEAVKAAASDMGWTIKPLVSTNDSNLSTTFDPARYRAASRYSIDAPDIGCDVTVKENERVISNCLVNVNVGGLKGMQTPDGVHLVTGDAWGFDQSMDHFIKLEAKDGRALPELAFSKLVSANLPNSIFMYLPQDDGTWLNGGEIVQ
ncbi:hypothetical protein DYI41_06305 [Marinobacter salarius]|jgi:hypothetical protein|uniref:hypothetical protein n=1 Tax=Marinobacter salarius TaxID=1420917 RepID=UPI001BCF5D47|nr:hypothetical protein [Marinobacter salarius]MBS8230537.1 hypothetical protein [Marinobacter salarius]|tara:strand:+ start:45533 stop:46165 length:633 start_codon:yes stop_codon:yes gene_type:complete